MDDTTWPADTTRTGIDAAFAAMAEAAEYQAEAQHIADEFALADWEALPSQEQREENDDSLPC